MIELILLGVGTIVYTLLVFYMGYSKGYIQGVDEYECGD